MNPKIQKLKTEREHNNRKIASLKERNKIIDGQITELENTDIIGTVREYELTPDMLNALLLEMKTKPVPKIFSEEEDKA